METDKTECVLPLVVRDPSSVEHVVPIDIMGGVHEMVRNIIDHLQYDCKTKFATFWSGDEITNDSLKGLSSGDTITLGELCNEKEIKKALMQENLPALTRLYKGGIDFVSNIPGTNRMPLEFTVGKREMLRHLSELGVDISHQFGNRRRTLLHNACAVSNEQDIAVLLQCKANPTIKDIDGNTPLHLVVSFGLVCALETFYYNCTQSISMNEYNSAGYVPLHYPCKQGQTSIIRKMVEFGCNPHLVVHRSYRREVSQLLKELCGSTVSVTSSIRITDELPMSRNEYFDSQDPTAAKLFDRSHKGVKLPRTRPTKQVYQKDIQRVISFTSVEKHFHESKKLPGVSYADMISGRHLIV